MPKPPAQIKVTLFELEAVFQKELRQTMEACHAVCDRSGIEIEWGFIPGGFHYRDCRSFGVANDSRFTMDFDCAILNPPYKKLNTHSDFRRLLSRCGMEVNNLYSAFLALTARLVKPSGELVAITPRSFCSGPYFKAFRRDFLFQDGYRPYPRLSVSVRRLQR